MWNFERDEMLIELVKEKRELYDPSYSQYNDYLAKKTGWTEISECLTIKGISGPHCKERWEQLRAQFRKNINKNKIKNENNEFCTKWRYDDQMTFLRPFLKERNGKKLFQETEENASNTFEESSTCEENEKSEELHDIIPKEEIKQEFVSSGYETSFQDDTPPNKKCRIASQNTTFPSLEENMSSEIIIPEISKSDPHSLEQFFSLMASTVKKFDPRDQLLIKKKVFSIIMETEEKYLNPNLETKSEVKLSVVDIPSSNS